MSATAVKKLFTFYNKEHVMFINLMANVIVRYDIIIPEYGNKSSSIQQPIYLS